MNPEVAHVLFIDIVGYSKESTSAQSRLLERLNALVNESPTFASARSQGKVMPLPTGDGMALTFFDEVFSPARCAREICGGDTAGLRMRMGIHSGLVQRQTDIAGASNVVGEGINTTQRIMDAGDEGHILLSEQYAGWLTQFDEWSPFVKMVGTATTKHGQELHVFNFFGEGFGRPGVPARVREIAGRDASGTGGGLSVVLIYRRKTQPDNEVLTMLEDGLGAQGHSLFVDRHLKVGVEWAKAIEEKLRSADAVVAILSDAAAGSEMLEYEIEIAYDEMKKRGKPYLLPVRVGTDKPVEGQLSAFVNGVNFSVWRDAKDNARVVAELCAAMTEPPKPSSTELLLEPVGGAVPPDSPFYLERITDAEFTKALLAHESILLVKGPRQIGKTSLIGRGTRLVRNQGWRQGMTDFQKLSSSHFGSEDAFYKLLAATLARQFKFTYDFAGEWVDVFGANVNLDYFMRALLESAETPLVWFMDEADKLFGIPFASDFFGLIRSWHNSRATEPGTVWSRFTVVIGYATEAHLFIQDLNQSPFNVGRQIQLRNFTLEESAELNRRYGSPLTSDQVHAVWELVAGQPFLTRRSLDVLARQAMDYETLMEMAARDDGPYGDHLKRIFFSLSQMPTVSQALRDSLTNPQLPDSEALQRLIASGLVYQTGGKKVQLMCPLYRDYLTDHLQ